MIRRHPLVAFMVVTCLYSWTIWFLMIASAHGWLPFRFAANPLGSFGPLVAACLLVRPSGLSPTLSTFLRQSLLSRPVVRWLWVAFLIPLLLTAAAVLAQYLVAGSLPAPQGLGRFYLLPAVFLLILVLGGPLGEEFGWRGYVLPILLRSRSPLVASMFLAVFWLVWHLPLFWLEGAAQEGTSILGFAVVVAAASVLFTWVYVHTAPRLVAVLLLHTSINVWSFILPSVLPGIDESRPFSLALMAVFVGAALLIAARDPRMRERAEASA